jgi:hypothetical protein
MGCCLAGVLALAACSDDGTGPSGDTSDGVTTTAGQDTVTGTSCGAGMVEVGFYSDANCANQVNSLTFDVTQSCFGWTRSDGAGGTRDNSATHFQCYKDRLCYTQHVENFTCSTTRPTDKVSYTSQCLQEPTGQALYAKILGGTASCPDAPAGFQCPESGTGAGTSGTSTSCN